MNAKVYQSGNHSMHPVAWYWEAGLHDARIISTELLDLDCDYKTKTPTKNSFTIIINASGALYDTSVKRIVLYNCKVLTPEIKLDGCYWLQDILSTEDNKYLLSITATDCKSANEHAFRILFEKADVIRN